jgi:hypothetical protein
MVKGETLIDTAMTFERDAPRRAGRPLSGIGSGSSALEVACTHVTQDLSQLLFDVGRRTFLRKHRQAPRIRAAMWNR